jgi:hypothetical protein
MSKDNKEKENGRLEEGQWYKKSKFKREHKGQTNKKTKKKRGEQNGFVGGWEEKGKKKMEGRARVGKGGEVVDSKDIFFAQNFARFRHEKYDFNFNL